MKTQLEQLKEKQLKIIDYYGYSAQLVKLHEQSANFIKTIFAHILHPNCSKSFEDFAYNLAEIEVIIEQMKLYDECFEGVVRTHKNWKIDTEANIIDELKK